MWTSRLMKTQEHKRWQLERMWRFNNRCYWCNRPTRLVKRIGQAKVKTYFDNEATIEHLDSRFSSERGKHPGEYRRVIACRKCNLERARVEENDLPIQTKWERSGAFRSIAKLHGALNEVD